MREHSFTGIEHDYLKSIAGLNADELWRVCLNPSTGVRETLTRANAATARHALGSLGTTAR